MTENHTSPQEAPRYRLEENEKEVHVIFTDIRLHTTAMRKPLSFTRAFEKAVRSGKPGRAYSNAPMTLIGSNGFEVPLASMEGVQVLIEKAQQEGKRIRFFGPKDGIPVFFGKDLVERVKSLECKGYFALKA